MVNSHLRNMEKKNCFWKHNWSKWEEKMANEIYSKPRYNPESQYILDYRIYEQRRFCQDCGFVDRRTIRLDY